MGEIPQLRLQHAKRFLRIAKTARGSRIPKADQWKFFDLIHEGALAFTYRPLSPKQRRQTIHGAISDAKSLANRLGTLLQSEEPLFEGKGFEVALSLQHLLIDFAKRMDAKAPAPKCGRPLGEGHFEALVFWLDQGWQTAVGRPASTTWYDEQSRRAGPFVDFVSAVLSWLEPSVAPRKALGDTVQTALGNIREWRERGEKT